MSRVGRPDLSRCPGCARLTRHPDCPVVKRLDPGPRAVLDSPRTGRLVELATYMLDWLSGTEDWDGDALVAEMVIRAAQLSLLEPDPDNPGKVRITND